MHVVRERETGLLCPLSNRRLFFLRAAFQALHKACELARAYNYYLDGLSHTSSAYYKTLLTGEW